MAFSARAADENWSKITQSVEGQDVNFSMWGGSENINQWVDKWVTARLREKYGVKLKRIPARDPADPINKLITEKQSGRKQGSIDLLWVNGENFKIARNADILHGPIAGQIPSYLKFYEQNAAENNFDFGTPTEGYEVPYGRAQFVFVYDSAKVKTPPQSFVELERWIAANPGKFTYPAPPDFTGSAFVRQALYATTGGPEQYMKQVNLDTLRKNAKATWDYLNRLKPNLWMKGQTYPESKARLDALFADGELWISMGYSPTTAEADIRKGLLPKTVRTFIMNEGTLANTHFLAIPFNAKNLNAALVLANFLLSPEAQLAKADPAVWGDFPAIDMAKLPESERKKFASLDLGISTLPLAILAAHRVPEIQSEYLVEIEKLWKKSVAAERARR